MSGEADRGAMDTVERVLKAVVCCMERRSTVEERLQYVETMERLLSGWEKDIERLRRRLQAEAIDGKEELLEQIENLEAKKREFKTRMDEIRAFSEEQWLQMSIAVERTQHELTTAIEQLRNKLES
jgi:hypothetical protein